MPSSKQVRAIVSWFQGLKIDVISKETIVLNIYGNRWLILYNDLTEDCRKGMKLIVSIA